LSTESEDEFEDYQLPKVKDKDGKDTEEIKPA